LSVLANTGDILSYLAGSNLDEFLSTVMNVKILFNYTLEELIPYVLPPFGLIQLYSENRKENVLCGTQDCYDAQTYPDYIRLRMEGYQPRPDEQFAVPLNNYWNGHDNYATTLTTPPPGYDYSSFKDGYILSKPKQGTIPVSVYYNSQRQDMLTVASEDGIKYAKSNNYELVNDTIGYFYKNIPTTNKKQKWIFAWNLLQGAKI